jgi:hypothetical protein
MSKRIDEIMSEIGRRGMKPSEIAELIKALHGYLEWKGYSDPEPSTALVPAAVQMITEQALDDQVEMILKEFQDIYWPAIEQHRVLSNTLYGLFMAVRAGRGEQLRSSLVGFDEALGGQLTGLARFWRFINYDNAAFRNMIADLVTAVGDFLNGAPDSEKRLREAVVKYGTDQVKTMMADIMNFVEGLPTIGRPPGPGDVESFIVRRGEELRSAHPNRTDHDIVILMIRELKSGEQPSDLEKAAIKKLESWKFDRRGKNLSNLIARYSSQKVSSKTF